MKKILRFLTQRVVLTALLILIQALLLFGIIWKLNNYFIYFYAFSVLLSLLLTLRIINNKSNPAFKIAWLIPILLFPVLGGLVYRGFVTGNGFKRLGDTLRYLQAIEKRLEKLAIDPHRDRAQMLKVDSVQQAWQQWFNKLPPARREDDDVKEIRWMIEELRVSYFAQQLGTPYPISDKRILQAMDQITG